MLAAVEGNLSMGKELVTRGARVETANQFGETPLSLAAHAGHEAFVIWLLKVGGTTDCLPHGWPLADWIIRTSGLSAGKLDRVLAFIRNT